MFILIKKNDRYSITGKNVKNNAKNKAMINYMITKFDSVIPDNQFFNPITLANFLKKELRNDKRIESICQWLLELPESV